MGREWQGMVCSYLQMLKCTQHPPGARRYAEVLSQSYGEI